jgi:ribonuclease HI
MNKIDYYFKINSHKEEVITTRSKDVKTIYLDGGTKFNGKKNAIGGIGIYNETDNIKISQKIVYTTFNKPVTNNICELYAILVAIETFSNDKTSLRIITDSQYCYNIFTKWASSWKKNDWKKKGGPILNLELIKKIYGKVILNNIKFQHCNSHTKEPDNKTSIEYKIWYGNFIADKLATDSMSSFDIKKKII